MILLSLARLATITAVFSSALFPAWSQEKDTGFADPMLTRLHAVEQSGFDLPQRERVDAIKTNYERSFRKLLSAQTLRGLSDSDLGYVFRATDVMAFYSRERNYLNDQASVLNEMERRKIATIKDREKLYRTLIGHREFAEARQHLAEHPNLNVEPLPTVVTTPDSDEKTPTTYQVSEERFELRKEFSDIYRGQVLIVVAHPLCAYSRSAMISISENTELFSELPKKIVWLAPVDSSLQFDAVQKWNRDYPRTPIVIAHNASEWPMIDSWATPTFYLLKDGSLIGQMSGWPQEGNRESLLKLLKQGEG